MWIHILYIYYIRTINAPDSDWITKNIYGNLKTKLIELIDEVPSIKNSLINPQKKNEDLIEENNIINKTYMAWK